MQQRRAIILTATPTLDGGNAYATGDRMHTAAMQFNLAHLRDYPDVWLEQVLIADKAAQSANIDLALFSAAIADGTINNAFDPSDAELLTLVGIVSITSHFAFSDNGASALRDIHLPLSPVFSASGAILYGMLIARASPTYAASDLQVSLSFRAEA